MRRAWNPFMMEKEKRCLALFLLPTRRNQIYEHQRQSAFHPPLTSIVTWSRKSPARRDHVRVHPIIVFGNKSRAKNLSGDDEPTSSLRCSPVWMLQLRAQRREMKSKKSFVIWQHHNAMKPFPRWSQPLPIKPPPPPSLPRILCNFFFYFRFESKNKFSRRASFLSFHSPPHRFAGESEEPKIT